MWASRPSDFLKERRRQSVLLYRGKLASPGSAPKRSSDPLYQLLRDEEVTAFNQRREKEKRYDFRGCTFRGSDLRGLDAHGLDLRDAYFRDADLRGVDLRDALLAGASFGSAKISGAYFPDDISAEEIRLSVEYGTRVRSGKPA